MFGKLLNYATSGIINLLAKYAVRASVAVPFVFAFAFGLAGLTVVLIEAFGYRDAYFLLAGGFAVLGVLAALAVWLKERKEERAATEESDTTAAAATAAETAIQLPAAIAAGTSGASTGIRDLATLASRNWPLVLAAGIALLILGAPEARYGPRGRLRH
jgi:lipid-A-disaccharide synthase-like uncharacterized protein